MTEIGPISPARIEQALAKELAYKLKPLFWKNYFHAGILDTFYALGLEGADLDSVGDIEKLRSEYMADVEPFNNVPCLRYKAKGMMREMWLGEAEPYVWAWFILAPPKIASGVDFFFGVEGKGVNYHVFYANFKFYGTSCKVEVDHEGHVDGYVDITSSLPSNYDTKLHIYGIQAKPGRVKFWIDGTVVATINTKYPNNCRSLAYVVQNSQTGNDAFVRNITVTSWNPKDFAIDVANGRTTVATAGTRVPISGDMEVISVTVKALRTNTRNIYVGDETVSSSNGYVLAPGEAVDIEIDNLSKVYIDADVSGEGVCWLANKEWM